MIEFTAFAEFLSNYEDFIRNRIATYIEENQISGAKLSNYLDKNSNYITNILNGKNNPSFDMLVKISFYFGLSLDKFFEGAPEPPPMIEIRKFYDKLTKDERKIFDQYVKLINKRK